MGKVIITLGILVLIVIGVIFYSEPVEITQNIQNNADKHNEDNAAMEQAVTPQQLSIPKLNVNASVERVGLDSSGKMDVPKNVDNVGWYDLGYKPGQKGNAVIAGHFDKADGSPSVFYNLENLTTGDKIYISGTNGKAYMFSVEKIARYPFDNFPIRDVFGDYSESRLNLITCQGTWDAAAKNYSHRIVVYARLTE